MTGTRRPSLLAAFLLFAAGPSTAILIGAEAASAQPRVGELAGGVGVLAHSEFGRDIPNGVGASLWGSAEVARWLRVTLALGRDHASQVRPDSLCESYLPPATGCVPENVEFHTVNQHATARVELVPPPLGALRFGAGVMGGVFEPRIRRTGLASRRTEEAILGGEARRGGTAWVASVERFDLFQGRFVVRAQVERLRLSFDGCQEGPWGVCGTKTSDRVSLLLGVRPGG
jgi:hypothetical protein